MAEVHHAADSSGFSIGDVQRIKKVFIEHASSAGTLGLRQFRAVMATVFPRLVMEGSVDVLFRDFDADGNGVCDFRELVVGLAGLAHGSLDHQVDLLFDLFDSDGDGALTVFELLRFVKESSDRRFQAVSRAVDAVTEAQTERRGYLTLAELGTVAYENPDVLQALAREVDAPLAATTLGQSDAADAVDDEAETLRRDTAERALQEYVLALRSLGQDFPGSVTFRLFFRSVSDMLQAERAFERAAVSSHASGAARTERLLSDATDASSATSTTFGHRSRAMDMVYESVSPAMDADPLIPPPMAWAMRPAASLSVPRFTKLLRWSFLGPPDGAEKPPELLWLDDKPTAVTVRPDLSSQQEEAIEQRLDRISALAAKVVAAAPEVLSPFDLVAKGLVMEPLEKVAALFRRLDSKCTGHVRGAAVARAILAMQGSSDRLLGVASKLIALMDADSDGAVSREEFREASTRHPSIMACMSMLLGADQNITEDAQADLSKRVKKNSRMAAGSLMDTLTQSDEPAAAAAGAQPAGAMLSPARLAPDAARDREAAAFDAVMQMEARLATAVNATLTGKARVGGAASRANGRSIAGIRVLGQARNQSQFGHRRRPPIVARQPGMAAKIGSACARGAQVAKLVRNEREKLKLAQRQLDNWAQGAM
jgi:Ca2+-binding EF-hand superfamily protein